jgi:hypothetical protein
MKFPWGDGELSMVRYKICYEINGREKLLVLRFDSLQKHARR